MRLRNTFKIDDKEITVKELTCEEIIKLLSEYAPEQNKIEENSDEANSPKNNEVELNTIFGIIGGFGKVVEIGVEGIELEDFKKMSPSEIALIYDEFKKVNKYFFEVAQKLNLGKFLNGIIQEVLQFFSKHVLNWLKQDMEKEFGNTDSLS